MSTAAAEDVKPESDLSLENLHEMRKHVYSEHLALTQTIERVAESVALKLIAKGHICAKAEIINILLSNIATFQQSVDDIKGLSEAHRLELKDDIKDLQLAIERSRDSVYTALDKFIADSKVEDRLRRDDLNAHLKKLYTRAEENATACKLIHDRLKNLVLFLVFAVPILASAFGWWVMEHKISMMDAIRVAHDQWLKK